MVALLAALALAAADPASQRPASSPAPASERPPLVDPDEAEIVRNLDVLERMELLRLLDVLEPRDDPPGTGAPPPGK